ncbi:MAG: hypothetical protein U5K37_09095 [Natrialbaceae archaeon]|nr:hypothetical protein [Natrialbaceae archaeon]
MRPRIHTETPLFIIGMVVLIVSGLAIGMTAMAAPVGAQSTQEASFDQVTAEVTNTALFGGASEVTFEYQASANAEVEFAVTGVASTTETSDGTESSATVRTGGYWFGSSYPLEVVATVGDQVCSATIDRGDGKVVVCDQGLPDATFESASAKVTKHSFWTGDVRAVTFEFETEPGVPVELQVGDITRSTTAEDGVTRETVKVGGWFHGAKYPLDISASTPNQTVTGTIERGDGWVTLEGVEPQPNFAVDIDADDVVTEGQTVSVNGTVENTGDAADTQNVTVAIADQSTTENVSLAPGRRHRSRSSGSRRRVMRAPTMRLSRARTIAQVPP